MTKLKNLATNCELKEQNDKIVKSVLVAGLLPQHDDIRVQLLMKERKLDSGAVCSENARVTITVQVNGGTGRKSTGEQGGTWKIQQWRCCMCEEFAI